MDNRDIFLDAISQLDKAAKVVDIDKEVLEKLKYSKSIIEVSIPVRMDDGTQSPFAKAMAGKQRPKVKWKEYGCILYK